jgi:RNA polymerase sigma factor (sigma-70 family)
MRGALFDGMVTIALTLSSTMVLQPRDLVAQGEALLKTHAGLVRSIANHLFRRRHYVDVDDLMRAGMIGLLEAIRWYGHEPALCFEAYAIGCIRGAMLEFVRESDWSRRPLPQAAAAKSFAALPVGSPQPKLAIRARRATRRAHRSYRASAR